MVEGTIMGTMKGQRRKTARRAYEPDKNKGRMERFLPWASHAKAKRELKKIGLPGWQIKQKGRLWAVYRPKGGKK